MKPWLSMMPVALECSAATACSAGSRWRAAAPSISCRPSTPLAAALRARALQCGHLRLVGGHHQLAAIAVRHAVRLAVGVEQAPALDAELRLEPIGRRVQPGMDDLAVARAGDRADGVERLDDDDLAAAQSQRACHGEPDHPGADDDAIDAVHVRRWRRRRCANAACAARPGSPPAGRRGTARPRSAPASWVSAPPGFIQVKVQLIMPNSSIASGLASGARSGPHTADRRGKGRHHAALTRLDLRCARRRAGT